MRGSDDNTSIWGSRNAPRMFGMRDDIPARKKLFQDEVKNGYPSHPKCDDNFSDTDEQDFSRKKP